MSVDTAMRPSRSRRQYWPWIRCLAHSANGAATCRREEVGCRRAGVEEKAYKARSKEVREPEKFDPWASRARRALRDPNNEKKPKPATIAPLSLPAIAVCQAKLLGVFRRHAVGCRTGALLGALGRRSWRTRFRRSPGSRRPMSAISCALEFAPGISILAPPAVMARRNSSYPAVGRGQPDFLLAVNE